MPNHLPIWDDVTGTVIWQGVCICSSVVAYGKMAHPFRPDRDMALAAMNEEDGSAPRGIFRRLNR